MSYPYFQNRTVLLTGATRGIGRHITLKLIDSGAHVLAIARDANALRALHAEYPDNVSVFPVDLASTDAATRVATWVAAKHPQCSVLINNAAIMVHTDFTKKANLADIENEILINLSAPIQLCTAMLPVLREQPTAAICNVTSGLAITPISDAAVYCATKSGLRHFTRVLRYQIEDAALNITVSEAVMTLVNTSLSRGDPAKKYPPEHAADDLLAGIAAGDPHIWIERTKMLWYLFRVSPALAYRLMRGR